MVLQFQISGFPSMNIKIHYSQLSENSQLALLYTSMLEHVVVFSSDLSQGTGVCGSIVGVNLA